MVLWEITLGTAYFLGLKRTYRLALRIQRRLISSKHPKTRDFVQRRTRTVFDVVLKVHQNIQERDIEVGRNLGNWILRWLDRLKPSAQIRGPPEVNHPKGSSSNMNITKQGTNHLKTPRSNLTSRNQENDRHLFSSSRTIWPKPFPTISMMMRSARPAGTVNQYRHLCTWRPQMSGPSDRIGVNGFGGVIRKDIMQYLLQN